MKTILILFFISLLCCGCSNKIELTQSQYDAFDDYVLIVGEKCMEYVDADNSMSLRDKNVYKTRHRVIKDVIIELKENNNGK